MFSPVATSRIVKELKVTLNQMGLNDWVLVVWVSGHEGIVSSVFFGTQLVKLEPVEHTTNRRAITSHLAIIGLTSHPHWAYECQISLVLG